MNYIFTIIYLEDDMIKKVKNEIVQLILKMIFISLPLNKSICARSAGQLKNSSAETRNDPNSRIRQARRRWKC